MGLCVLYYVEYSLFNVKKVGFFLSGLELHFKLAFKGSINNIFQDSFNKILSKQLTHDRFYISAEVNQANVSMHLTHFPTMTPFYAPGKQAF